MKDRWCCVQIRRPWLDSTFHNYTRMAPHTITVQSRECGRYIRKLPIVVSGTRAVVPFRNRPCPSKTWLGDQDKEKPRTSKANSLLNRKPQKCSQNVLLHLQLLYLRNHRFLGLVSPASFHRSKSHSDRYVRTSADQYHHQLFIIAKANNWNYDNLRPWTLAQTTKLRASVPVETWSKFEKLEAVSRNSFESFPLFATAVILGTVADLLRDSSKLWLSTPG